MKQRDLQSIALKAPFDLAEGNDHTVDLRVPCVCNNQQPLSTSG
jgi:hypothetical protein